MKRYLVKIALFLLLVVGVDRGLGGMLSYMSSHTDAGYIGHHNYIVDRSRDDILVFGSSRAIHHYNTPMMQDSLGLTCYNCGQDGEGIILFYGWWQLISQRYHPRMAIYELTASYDIMPDPSNRVSGWLKGLYDREPIKREIDEIDSTEKYKMLSWLYRYNSKGHQILIDYFHPVHNISRGFLPVDSELDPLAVRTDERLAADEGREVSIDSLKLKYFNDMIDHAGSTQFVFVCSPSWYGVYDKEMDVLKQLARERHIPFLDFSRDPKYVHHDEYFYDGYHMNARGADEFTHDLMSELKNRNILP